MIKRFVPLFIVSIVLFVPFQLSAQSTTGEIENLGIEIWPDYDEPAALVLLTGYFTPETIYPTTLTLTLPENAEINTIAHITTENSITDQDVEYTIEENELTFTTIHPGFRIEYYYPYTSNGLDREFSYTWQSETAVNNLLLLVQQPFAATTLSTTPSASSSAPSNDGLTYHALPTQSLTAGEPFTVDVAYTMNTLQLTSDMLLNNQNTSNTTTATENEIIPNWSFILAGVGLLLILLAIGWQLLNKQKGKRKANKPQKRHPTPTPIAKFCHECGTPLQPKDKFCRNCGTAVKQ